MAQAAERDGAGGRNYNTVRLRATGLDPAHPGEGTQGRVEMWLFLGGREGVCRELPGGRSTSRAFPLTGLVRREGVQGGQRRTGRDSSIWRSQGDSPRLENILFFVSVTFPERRTRPVTSPAEHRGTGTRTSPRQHSHSADLNASSFCCSRVHSTQESDPSLSARDPQLSDVCGVGRVAGFAHEWAWLTRYPIRVTGQSVLPGQSTGTISTCGVRLQQTDGTDPL